MLYQQRYPASSQIYLALKMDELLQVDRGTIILAHRLISHMNLIHNDEDPMAELLEEEKYARKHTLLKKALAEADKMDAAGAVKEKSGKAIGVYKRNLDTLIKPTLQIHLLTFEGEAVITSLMPWNEIGEYTVTGSGAEMCRQWIEYAHGAFGHYIGKYAAPCDLHRAAMQLYQEAQPEDDVVIECIDGEVLEYDSKVPKGSLT
jgi:hypothetical protein